MCPLQVKAGTIFDNVLLTDSVEEAKEHAAETFEKLREAEKEQKEAADKEAREKVREGVEANQVEMYLAGCFTFEVF